jgi:ribosomal protein S18 acetylase RimI-like enzyme
MEISRANNSKYIDYIKALFLQYAEALNVDLSFQNFEDELKVLPGKYSEPEGALLIALEDNEPIGCIALRKIDDETCEMKRLFVKPEYRNMRLGKRLVEEIIKEGKQIGYKSMKLDTLKSMESAVKLYKYFGFKETEPYIYNPIKDAIYMELKLV